MNVPRYPEFRAVELRDRPVFEEHFRRFPPEVCELEFANIFIWRHSEHPRYTFLNGNLCLFCEPDFEPPYAFPPVGETALRETVEVCLSHAPRLSRATEAFVRDAGAGLRSEEDPNNFDYVYLARDLAELGGKRYDGKRNRIRKFESAGRHGYAELGPAHIEECRRLFTAWFADKENHDPFLRAEKGAILEALDRYETLGLRGGVVVVDGRVEAFTVGGPLNPETAVIQIEIANQDIVGLAQYINREFARRAWPGMTYLNREQDCGVPGLRRAKLSYQPHRLVKKFNLFKA